MWQSRSLVPNGSYVFRFSLCKPRKLLEIQGGVAAGFSVQVSDCHPTPAPVSAPIPISAPIGLRSIYGAATFRWVESKSKEGDERPLDTCKKIHERQVRLGDRQSGLRQIEAGLKGIRDFLNYITYTFSSEFGQYWDPNRDIRKAIESALAMISGGNFDWPTLITEGERIGMQIEEEADKARRDQEQQQQMERTASLKLTSASARIAVTLSDTILVSQGKKCVE